MQIYKHILIGILTATATCVNAQNGINTPYSRYGFGVAADRAMGFNKAMSGTAQGFRDGQIINVANPASYSEVDSLTALFDFGFTLQHANMKMSGLSQNAKNITIDYAAFHFRAHKGLGMTVALLPLTNIGYSFATTAVPVRDESGNEVSTESSSFKGDGGLHQVMLGAGWQIFKPLSIGANVGYIWGDYEHNASQVTSNTSSFALNRKYSADISTYNVDVAMQYTQRIGKDNSLTLGATYTLGHDIGSSAYNSTQSTQSSAIKSERIDTIKSAFQLPHQIAVGLAFKKGNSLQVGADFELQKWSNCKFPYQTDNANDKSTFVSKKGTLNDRMKISAGASWQPNMYDNSYASRIIYKVGAYYSTSYAKADLSNTISGKPIEYGISAGVSLPITNRHLWYNSPKVNLTFQWVHSSIPYLGTTMVAGMPTPAKANLTENYFKLAVGITFSERWFFKWKVN